MMWAYLAGLLVSLGGLAALDWRFKLALWHDRRRTMLTLGASVLLFMVWDMLAITLGIFKHGASRFALPVTLFPEFPIEEIFFLVLLCYTTLLLFRGAQRACTRI